MTSEIPTSVAQAPRPVPTRTSQVFMLLSAPTHLSAPGTGAQPRRRARSARLAFVAVLCPAFFTTLCAALLPSPASAQGTQDSDKMENKTFSASTGNLSYLLFTPQDYDPSRKYPLVVSLRGAGSTYIQATDNFEMAHPWIEDSIQARVPHFIVVPEPLTGSWGPIGPSPSNGVMNGSAKAVVELIEQLEEEYSLDDKRYILTGFSLGGSGTYHLIELEPDLFAAAIPAAAGGDTNQIASIAKTPIWHHQGSTDGTAGIRMAKALDDHGHRVVRVTVDFTINNPNGWRTAVQGSTPEAVAYKNIQAPVTLDSLKRAIAGGADYLYTELTGGNHEAGWMGAAHNPLVAAWAFSKVKGGAVSLAPRGRDSHRARPTIAAGASSGFTRILLQDGRGFSLSGRAQASRRNAALP